MQTKQLSFDFEFVRKPKFVKLQGSREEHVLFSVYGTNVLDESLKNISDQIKSEFSLDKTLVYASVIVAKKGSAPSSFFEEHADGEGRNFVKSLIYLTDVPDITHGPLEFGGVPVLGNKGTTILFDSDTLHIGHPNTSTEDRLVLTMIFVSPNLSSNHGCSAQECLEYCTLPDGTMSWCDSSVCDCENDPVDWSLRWTYVLLGILFFFVFLSVFYRF